MNVREYYEKLFPDYPKVLDIDGGAGDDCSIGDMLSEMPVDSTCGQDCKRCIDNAASLINSVREGYGEGKRDEVLKILEIATDVCALFIRG